MQRYRYFIKNLLVFTLFFGGLMFASLLMPGNFKQLDAIRLKLEVPILLKVWNISGISTNEIHPNPPHNFWNEPEPGSLIFTKSQPCLGNYFIGGYWTHVSVYIGSKVQIAQQFGKESSLFKTLQQYYTANDPFLILDCNTNGVQLCNADDLMRNHKNKSICQMAVYPIRMSKEDCSTFLTYALLQVGKPYDFDLCSLNDEKHYCAELVVHALNKVNIPTHYNRTFLGRQYITPTDLLQQLQTNGTLSNAILHHPTALAE